MATGGIKVHVYGDYDNRDIKRAQRDLESLKTQGGRTGQAMNYLKGAAIGAGIAAGAMAIKFGIDGVQAAIADEAAVSKLSKAMENLGLANDTGRVLAMIDAMQRQYGVSEDLLRPSFQRLVTSLGDTDKAMAAVQLAMDISAGTGKSLETVTAALGKAYDGNTGGLSRLGAGIDKAILKTGDMQQITAALSEKFQGQAATAAGTWQGSINRVSVAFDELKEAFGYGFLDGLGKAQGGVDGMTTSLKDLEPAMQQLGSDAGSSLVNLVYLIKAVQDVKKGIDDWRASASFLSKVAGPMIDTTLAMAGGWNTLADAVRTAKDAFTEYIGVQSLVYTGGTTTPLGPSLPESTVAPHAAVRPGKRAAGGHVMGGSPYIVGDAGRPEMFVPSVSGTIMPRVPSASGGNTYQIKVEAGVGDPRQIGQQVVEVIRKFEKANGPVWTAA